ncbi:MAG: CxxC-x17-CxxC domain-containing protein [Patescibacteria group bacterium]|jgi:CxxC-x17-CxxC domain-containing protein
MKNFNRDSGFNYKKGGGMKDGQRAGGFGSKSSGGFGGKSGGGRSFSRDDRDSERPEMHRATCAECGASCEVPFKPLSGKPVFCSNCFKGKEESSPRRTSDRGSFRSSSRDSGFKGGHGNDGISKEQFEILNAKLDKILQSLT